MTNITIYHNPKCGTSRNTLALIRNTGTEPRVIHYLETPPSRTELVALIAAMGTPVREVMRRKEASYKELDLDNPKWSDDELIDFMLGLFISRRSPSHTWPVVLSLAVMTLALPLNHSSSRQAMMPTSEMPAT